MTIITLCGSTTECYYISEGKTWPDLLAARLSERFDGIWVNNAGMDGHSSFGSIAMMEAHIDKIRPKVVIFLVGLNDVGLATKTTEDSEVSLYKPNGWISDLAEHSKLVSIFDNYLCHRKAEKHDLTHFDMGHNSLDFKRVKYAVSASKAEMAERRSKHAELNRYFQFRLRYFIRLARAHDIEPVLVTQPVLYGEGVDPETGVDLGNIQVGDLSGADRWSILEMYNDTTRQVGASEGVWVVDLASELPKNSKYFYDFNHYSNQGAAKVAEIIAEKLSPFLARAFPARVSSSTSASTR